MVLGSPRLQLPTPPLDKPIHGKVYRSSQLKIVYQTTIKYLAVVTAGSTVLDEMPLCPEAHSTRITSEGAFKVMDVHVKSQLTGPCEHFTANIAFGFSIFPVIMNQYVSISKDGTISKTF